MNYNNYIVKCKYYMKSVIGFLRHIIDNYNTILIVDCDFQKTTAFRIIFL